MNKGAHGRFARQTVLKSIDSGLQRFNFFFVNRVSISFPITVRIKCHEIFSGVSNLPSSQEYPYFRILYCKKCFCLHAILCNQRYTLSVSSESPSFRPFFE